MSEYIEREAVMEAVEAIAKNADKGAVFVVWPICGMIKESVQAIPAADVRSVKRGELTNLERIKEIEDAEEMTKAIFHALKVSNYYTSSRLGMIEWLKGTVWEPYQLPRDWRRGNE